MKKIVYEINSDNYIVKSFIADIIENTLPQVDNIIYSSLPNGLYNPKWNGTEWIEGATQEEINEMTKVETTLPTEIELLQEQILSQQLIIDELLLEVIPSLLPNQEGEI